MTIKFSVPNQAYVIVSGSELIDIDGQRFFADQAALKAALASKGLEAVRERGEWRVRCAD